jgi:hypothetical protein
MSSPTVPSTPVLGSGTEMGPHLVTALFRNQDEAEEAVKQLLDIGIGKDAIRLTPGYERDRPDGGPESRPALDPAVGSGFTAAADEFFRAENARGYDADGLNQGGWLVSVHTTDADRERVVDVLGQNGRIDEDEPDVA